MAAAIRYRSRPAGGISAKFIPEISSSEEKPVNVPQTTSIDPNDVPDSQIEDDDIEATGTYSIEC